MLVCVAGTAGFIEGRTRPAILPHGGNRFREKLPDAVFVGNGRTGEAILIVALTALFKKYGR
jgi:hypothetical protein